MSQTFAANKSIKIIKSYKKNLNMSQDFAENEYIEKINGYNQV